MIFKDFKDDLIYFFSEEYWDLFVFHTDKKMGILNSPPNNLPRKGMLLRMAIFLFGLFRSVINFSTINFSKRDTNNIQKSILILSESDNEYNSTKFIESYSVESVIYCGAIKSGGSIPLRSYLYGALFLPLLPVRFIFCTQEQRYLHKFLTDQFLLVMGWRAIQRNIYRTQNISAVIYSNHLSPVSRSAVAMSRILSKACVIYIEHVPAMEYYPHIEADIYCLSGQFSLNSLQEGTKVSGKDIYLVGSPKNDEINHRVKKNNHYYIGLAVNNTDDILLVREMVAEILSKDKNFRVFIRPHPSFKNFKKLLDMSHSRLLVRSPDQESVNDYLRSISTLIVNDSGIFFEGILSGVDVIRVKLSNEYLNNYGLPEEYSLLYDKSYREIVDYICSQKSSCEHRQQKIKFFFSNISTKFENNAADISFNIISHHVQRDVTIESKLHRYLSKEIHNGNRIYNYKSN